MILLPGFLIILACIATAVYKNSQWDREFNTGMTISFGGLATLAIWAGTQAIVGYNVYEPEPLKLDYKSEIVYEQGIRFDGDKFNYFVGDETHLQQGWVHSDVAQVIKDAPDGKAWLIKRSSDGDMRIWGFQRGSGTKYELHVPAGESFR